MAARAGRARSGYVWDRRAKRWRRGGKWAKPPRKSQLKRDKAGRLRDAAGKLVPLSALPAKAKPKKPAKTKPKKPAKAKPKKPAKAKPKKLAKPIARLRRVIEEVSAPRREPAIEKPRLKTRKIEKLLPGRPIVQREFISSGMNKRSPSNVSDIFERMLDAVSKRGPFEAGDIPVFQYGFKLAGEHRLSKDMLAKLSKAAGKEVQVKYADTSLGTEVFLALGSSQEPMLKDQVLDKLERITKRISLIYGQLLDYWGSLDWWYWFESDEAYYE